MKKVIFLAILYGCSLTPLSRSDIRQHTSLPLNKQLKPFSSDGCSLWPEGTSTNPGLWIHCCFYHDIAYWIGGSRSARKKADKKFKSCVKKEHKQAAELMYLGARKFGGPKIATNYRWGYGWTYGRGYLKLSQQEKKFADGLLPKKNEKISKYVDLDQTDVKEIPIYILEKYNLETYDP